MLYFKSIYYSLLGTIRPASHKQRTTRNVDHWTSAHDVLRNVALLQHRIEEQSLGARVLHSGSTEAPNKLQALVVHGHIVKVRIHRTSEAFEIAIVALERHRIELSQILAVARLGYTVDAYIVLVAVGQITEQRIVFVTSANVGRIQLRLRPTAHDAQHH